MSTSPAAYLARLKVTYGPRWHITATIPGTGPRTLTAVEMNTGRRIHAQRTRAGNQAPAGNPESSATAGH